MAIIRSPKLDGKLKKLRKSIYERQRFKFNNFTGQFIKNPKTNRKIPIESHTPKYCTEIADKRLNEINKAIDGLTHSANPNHTFTTPKGRTVYFTVPSKATANTYIFYMVVLNNGQQDLYVFNVRLKGFPLDKILEVKDSYNYPYLSEIIKCYENHKRVSLSLRKICKEKYNNTILEYLATNRY